jgi:uncharacterized membrane protein
MAQSARIRRKFAASVPLAGFIAAATLAQAAPAGSPPTVNVTPDPQGASGIVHAQIDINAAPETVWKIMVDCDQVPKLMANVKYCHVLQHDPAGHWDVREQVTKASLLPSVRVVMRSDYDEPRSVHFHRTDGDLKIVEGSWLLQPLDGGARTRVVYDSRIAAPFSAPGMLVRPLMRGDMVHTLTNLRAACEAKAGGSRVAAADRP